MPQIFEQEQPGSSRGYVANWSTGVVLEVSNFNTLAQREAETLTLAVAAMRELLATMGLPEGTSEDRLIAG